MKTRKPIACKTASHMFDVAYKRRKGVIATLPGLTGQFKAYPSGILLWRPDSDNVFSQNWGDAEPDDVKALLDISWTNER